MKRIALDIAYRVRQPIFLLSVLMGAGSLLLIAWSELIPSWAIVEADLVYLHELFMYEGPFHTFAPLLAVLPNVGQLRRFTSDEARYELSRCSHTRRLTCQAVSSCITGGLTLMLAPLLVLGVLSLHYPIFSEAAAYSGVMDPPHSFSSFLIAGRYGTYLAVKLSFVFLYGVSVNMLAMLCASWTRDSFVIAFFPMIAISTYANYANYWTVYFRPRIYLHTSLIVLPECNTPELIVRLITPQVIIWIVCFIISQIIAKRRIRNA